jgi:hypothetical protein
VDAKKLRQQVEHLSVMLSLAKHLVVEGGGPRAGARRARRGARNGEQIRTARFFTPFRMTRHRPTSLVSQ